MATARSATPGGSGGSDTAPRARASVGVPKRANNHAAMHGDGSGDAQCSGGWWERLDIAQEAYWDMTDWPRYSASRHSPTTAEPPFRLTVQVGTETTAVRLLGGAVGLVIDHAREAWRQHGLLIRVPAHWDAFKVLTARAV